MAFFRPHGDKSICHRLALLSILTEGECEIQNYNTGKDFASTINFVKSCGAQVVMDERSVWIKAGELPQKVQIDCGNSATTMRLGAGLLAGLGIHAELTGDDSLSRRPMDRIVEPLQKMGADIQSTDGHAPLKIAPAKLHGMQYELPVPSAQVKSAILFAGLRANSATKITETIPTRNHSEIILKELGAEIHFDSENIVLQPMQMPFHRFSTLAPGDASASAVMIFATSLLRNKKLRIENMLDNPIRRKYLQILEMMDSDIQIMNQRVQMGERVCDLIVKSSYLHAISIEPEDVPALIDELPLVFLAATIAEGVSQFYGLGELRHKESDRFELMVSNLKSAGVRLHVNGDDIRIFGGFRWRDSVWKTEGDHRIAMTGAIAEVLSKGRVQVDSLDCTKISFPEFERLWKKFRKK